ncbi:MFS-type transporter SLC18B1 isoform X2 [Protopterus annectens]|nr:MFS-type transporter SLC18B1 isoform X2 [Protopterus annectens]XP_043919741.1 MFS-type transporter SLC18B1 isoform X2 [Protopterus annectens]
MSREQILVLIATASVNFSSMICYSILGPFFPGEAEQKGASDTIIGMIFGCYALVNVLFSLILGKYIVQVGAKFMFVGGMFLSGGCTILFGLLDRAPDGPIYIAMCFVVRTVDAVGFSGAMTSSFAVLTKSFPQNVATVMGTLEIFTGLGLVLGPPLGGILYEKFGYEIPFIVLGCVVLLMVPLNMYTVPTYDDLPIRESFWDLFRIPKISLMCLVMLSLSSALTFLDPTMSLFLIEKFHLSTSFVGLIFFAIALPYSISAPLLGYLADKFPATRKWMIIFGSLLTGICYVFLGPAPFFHIKSSIWLFSIMMVVLGISTSMTGIPVFPEILESAYKNNFEEGLSTLGLVSGLFGAVWSLGTFIGPTLGGYLNEKLHFEYAAAIQGGIALVIGAAMGIFYIAENYQEKRSSVRNTTVQMKNKNHCCLTGYSLQCEQLTAKCSNT